MALSGSRQRYGGDVSDVGHAEREFLDEVMRRRQVMPARTLVYNPPTDVFETEDAVVVMVEIAGLQDGNFRVSLGHRHLTIAGVREDPAAKLVYHQMEIPYGQFMTQVYLPWPVDEDLVQAVYESGFLRVVLRKAASRRVPVTARRGEASP